MLPLPGMDLKGVLSSDELFKLEEMPESLVIIGGGVISVEFATAFSALGCKVTILEAMPRLVPNMDKEISQSLKMLLKKRDIDVHPSAGVQSVEERDGAYVCKYTEKEKRMRSICPATFSAQSDVFQIQKDCLRKMLCRRWKEVESL